MSDLPVQAAAILYALCREAGFPYSPPHGTTLQLHIEKDTWHKARAWYAEADMLPPPDPTDPDTADEPDTINANALDFLAATLHAAYEQAAPLYGWETNPATHVPWNQLPTPNQNTMRAALRELLKHLDIHVTPDPDDPRASPQHNQ